MRIKLTAVLLLLSAVSVVCAFNAAAQTSVQRPDDWYYEKPIKTIVFEGLKNISKSELDGITAPFIGKLFSDDTYFNLLERLYALEFFEDISPVALPADGNYDSVTLLFKVKERPIISSIRFKGNSGLRTSELLDAVTLKERDIYNELKARMDERAIRDLYLQKGFTNIRVSSSASEAPSGVTLEFNINEGGQTVITSIKFEGNTVVATNTLKGQLSLKEASLFNKGAFQEAALENDKVSILKYYWNRGYIDARITNVVRTEDTETVPEKNQLTITFIISEGSQYTYGGTSFTGNTLFTSEQLASKIRLKPGDLFNYTRYEEGQMAVADLYYENGYTSNIITREEIRDPDKKEISFVINIVEMPRSHVENIIIRGNTKTKDSVILREIPLQPGDIFSKTKLMSGLRNLYNLQFFSAIVPEITQGSEQNLVDVVLSLEEGNTTSIEFGITFSGMATADTLPFSLFAKFQDVNLLGLGQTLSASVILATDQQDITLGYAYKWLLGFPLTLNFNFNVGHSVLSTQQQVFFPEVNTKDFRMKYDQWDFSLGVATGYRWLPSFAIVTLQGGFSFSLLQNFYDSTLFVPVDETIRKNHGKWNWNNTVWTSVSLDNRDIYYDPSRGWFFKEKISWTGLFPHIENEYYFMSETKAEGYLTFLNIPVTDAWNLKFVLAGYSGFSIILPWDNKVGESSRFYVDGMFNGRGWTVSSPKRGNAMWSNWLEIRMPIVTNIISLDIFADAVALKDTAADMFTNLSLDDFYFSFGFGPRFSIPQFPLRLLWGVPFQVKGGQVKWGTDGKASGPTLQFTLSFNIANQ